MSNGERNNYNLIDWILGILLVIADAWGFIALYAWAMSGIKLDIVSFSCVIVFLMTALHLVIISSKRR